MTIVSNVRGDKQELVKMLKADLAAERQRSSELELEVHESQNNSEDLQRQLTMVRKKEGIGRAPCCLHDPWPRASC